MSIPCGKAHADLTNSASGPTQSVSAIANGAVRISPSWYGSFGAFLALGPFAAAPQDSGVSALDYAPRGFDERDLIFSKGKSSGATRKRTPKGADESIDWHLIQTAAGALDLKRDLSPPSGDSIAYLAGILHVEHAGTFHLIASANDGVRLSLDGITLTQRDDARPFRQNDDVVTQTLAAGDHAVLIKLHSRGSDWQFQLRILDENLNAARNVELRLPGTTTDDADALAATMATVDLTRTIEQGAIGTTTTFRYREGFPLGTHPHATVSVGNIFRAQLGQPLGFETYRVQFPYFSREELAANAVDIQVGPRHFGFPYAPLASTQAVLSRAETLLAKSPTEQTFLPVDSRVSLTHLTQRLRGLALSNDTDSTAQDAETGELNALIASAELGRDPFADRTGPQRRAHIAKADGGPQEFGLYVPPSYRPGAAQKYPLIVVLHGLNSTPMAMLRWFFGGDDPKRDQPWEDRHWDSTLPRLEAFVVTPSGHGNSGYRELGETEVLDVLEWTKRTYPIDDDRVTITGPSMGGIGSAALPLRSPTQFAAAMPLCGYHSYFVRGDFLGKPIRPWERFLAEERSNVEWAKNGSALPMYIVHGTRDLPEENSKVLIDRYEKLHYSVEHEHPDLGHNVWQPTYEGLKGAKWLLKQRRRSRDHIVFRTAKLRFGISGWLGIDALESPNAWGEIDAHHEGTAVRARVSGVSEFHLGGQALVGVTTVAVNGTRIALPAPLAAGTSIALRKTGNQFQPVVNETSADRIATKHAGLSGPFRDIFYEPLVFVYGTADPALTRANREVAETFATMGYGVSVHYPVISDEEYLKSQTGGDDGKALFLVGPPRSNRVLASIEAALPIRVQDDSIVAFGETYRGTELGAAFVYPNPRQPNRYVAVVYGLDIAGMYRATSLPELIPDFAIYDHDLRQARNQKLLGAAQLRAAGFFSNDWKTALSTRDPFARH